jgi:hypothetical protein
MVDMSGRCYRPLRTGCRRKRPLGIAPAQPPGGGEAGKHCCCRCRGRSRGAIPAGPGGDVAIVARVVHPRVPVRPIGVLLPVAHLDVVSGAPTGTPLLTWAVVVRQVRLVRVRPISAGNRGKRHNRCSTNSFRPSIDDVHINSPGPSARNSSGGVGPGRCPTSRKPPATIDSAGVPALTPLPQVSSGLTHARVHATIRGVSTWLGEASWSSLTWGASPTTHEWSTGLWRPTGIRLCRR